MEWIRSQYGVPAKRGETNGDMRFGALAYGFIRHEPVPNRPQDHR